MRKRLKHLRRVKPKRTKFKLVLNGPEEAGKPSYTSSSQTFSGISPHLNFYKSLISINLLSS